MTATVAPAVHQPPVLDAIAAPVRRLEADARLDAVAKLLDRAARPVAQGQAREVLAGAWLGHALHPLLTDFPLGCWLASGLLDLVGGRRARGASQRLVGLGVLFTVPTALSGLSDWSAAQDPRVRRVGTAHALLNGAIGTSYFLSWRARRRGHHLRGVALGLTGGLAAWVSGYLGGHLSLTRGSGVTNRYFDADAASAPPTPPA
jgi:uncharacterized membrane protein